MSNIKTTNIKTTNIKPQTAWAVVDEKGFVLRNTHQVCVFATRESARTAKRSLGTGRVQRVSFVAAQGPRP